MIETPMNSYKVTIKRLLPFVHEAQKGQLEWLAASNKSIGDYFMATNSKKVATGLSLDEIDYIMPRLINAEPEDRNFRKEVEGYFMEMNTKIPVDGLELQIGKKIDNNKPIYYMEDGKKIINPPLDLEDYVKYKHAIGFPFLALTKAIGDSIPNMWFYLEDKHKEVTQEADKQIKIDKALSHYLEIAKESSKVNMYLTLLGVVVENVEEALRTSTLKAKAEQAPTMFIKVVTDDNAKTKYQIRRLLSRKILTKEGSRYLFEGEQLAISEIDMVEFLKDAANSQIVGTLKARYDNL